MKRKTKNRLMWGGVFAVLAAAGKEEEAMRHFRCARLRSAQRFLLDGEEAEACYEFFHSLDDATPEALFATLKKN